MITSCVPILIGGINSIDQSTKLMLLLHYKASELVACTYTYGNSSGMGGRGMGKNQQPF